MGLGTGATAAIIGGIGAAGSVASGVIGANASGKAADAQSQAAMYAANLQNQQATNSLNFQKQVYGQQQQNLQPWLQTGTGALSNLSNLMGITPQSPSSFSGAPASASATAAPTTTQPLQTYRGNPATLTTGGVSPGQSLSTLAGVAPRKATTTVGQGAAPTNTIATTQGASGGFAPGQPLSTLAGTPAASTGIDPATGFQTGAGGGTGSLAQGWNQEFHAPTASEAAQTPGYQFQLQEGLRALQNSAAAKGGLLSGNTAEALDKYSQGLADSNYQQTYNNALGQYQQAYNQFSNNQANTFNRLSALSGTGQVAANQLNSAGQSAANNIGNISLTSGQQIGQDVQNAGAANASGYVGGANAIGGAIGGVSNSLGQGLLLSQLLGNQNNGMNGIPVGG